MLIADCKLDRSLNQQLGDDETMVSDVSDLDDCYTGGQRWRYVSDDVEDTVRASRRLNVLRVAVWLEGGREVGVDGRVVDVPARPGQLTSPQSSNLSIAPAANEVKKSANSSRNAGMRFGRPADDVHVGDSDRGRVRA